MTERLQYYLTLLLFLEGALLGVFTALDLVLFYFFWEAVLIPAYFMIGTWGGDRRIYAAFKYVLYTMTGSLLMLVGILLLFAQSTPHSFDLTTLIAHPLAPDVQKPVFLAFALAFGIKAALFPFHSWVPDVYTESNAPTAIILSGVLSKMGIYGFLRIGLPLFPDAVRYFSPALMILSAIGIVYGALLCLYQRDGKRLVACSSIAHLGFIMLGIFSLSSQGVQGATLQAVNHGVTIAALFAILAVIAGRWGTTDLSKLSGLAKKAPVTAAIFLLATLSALGLPGLNGFAGEFLILVGSFQGQRRRCGGGHDRGGAGSRLHAAAVPGIHARSGGAGRAAGGRKCRGGGVGMAWRDVPRPVCGDRAAAGADRLDRRGTRRLAEPLAAFHPGPDPERWRALT